MAKKELHFIYTVATLIGVLGVKWGKIMDKASNVGLCQILGDFGCFFGSTNKKT